MGGTQNVFYTFDPPRFCIPGDVQGCQSIPLKKPETNGKNLEKHLNLNQNSQKWTKNK